MIADLVRKVDVLTEEVATLRTQVAVPEETELKCVYGLGPAASKVYGVDRGLSIGGYGEALYVNFVGDEEDDDLDSLELRSRTVLYIGYKFTESIVFNSEIEFEHATTEGRRTTAKRAASSGRVRRPRLLVPEVERARRSAARADGLHQRGPRAALLLRRAAPRDRAAILPRPGARTASACSAHRREPRVPRLRDERLQRAGLQRRGHPRRPPERQPRAREDFAFVGRVDWTPEPMPGC